MTGSKKPAPLEFTLRGVILGVLITLVFTAANVYLGIKVGMTFATSIPAAVISMAALSAFRNSTILENNIVQTVASAAGTLSAIIFVLPGLVIVGWWSGFSFWQNFLVCAAGGILGVLFTIPLRRAMVTTSDLPYPEGVAAAEVLEVGARAREAAGAEAREGLIAVVYGAVASAGLACLAATRVAAGEFTMYFPLGGGAESGIDMGWSLALAGAGYLVGISVGLAMLLGLIIAWGGAVPLLTLSMAAPAGMSAAAHAADIWTNQVRFIGAGTIAIAAIWTLLKLGRPVITGVMSTLGAARARKQGIQDRQDIDMSIGWIALLAAGCLIVIGFIMAQFLAPTALAHHSLALIATALPFVFLGGFLIAAICGYMAGLIGASNSPISGVGILAIVICAALFLAIAHPTGASKAALVAFALFATAIVFAIATISNNNLQDLKTGQLVGATPAAQQWALIVGVIAGAAIIPPVLNLLAQAFGFAGAANLHTVTAQPLAAPQATLIAALAQGVIEQKLNTTMIGIGLGVGTVVIIIDELLGLARLVRLPPLAVGIGIYLPMSATLPIVVGAIIGHLYTRWARRRKNSAQAEQLGVLVASGMIVGESLFGVILAGLIVAFSSQAPLALVGAHFVPAGFIGFAAFALLIASLYGWMMNHSRAD